MRINEAVRSIAKQLTKGWELAARRSQLIVILEKFLSDLQKRLDLRTYLLIRRNLIKYDESNISDTRQGNSPQPFQHICHGTVLLSGPDKSYLLSCQHHSGFFFFIWPS